MGYMFGHVESKIVAFQKIKILGSETFSQVANLKFMSFWLSQPSDHCVKDGHKG